MESFSILPRLFYLRHLYLVLIITYENLPNMSQISKNFSLAELIRTSQPYGNRPDLSAAINLCYGVHRVLQPLRDYLGCPITITSAYRCSQVNKAVGGVANSQHLTGNAADCVVPRDKFTKAVDFITENLPYDQLLIGKSFFHVSWVIGKEPRKQRIDGYYNY